MSNVLGTITPFAEIAEAAHDAGAVVLADGAQSVPHLPTDVAALGCDFLAFSAHKMLGPTGIGVLWGRRELLEAMPPFLGGGGMIRDVRHDGFSPNVLPWKFEAGTPPDRRGGGLRTRRSTTSTAIGPRRHPRATRRRSPPTPSTRWPSASATT